MRNVFARNSALRQKPFSGPKVFLKENLVYRYELLKLKCSGTTVIRDVLTECLENFKACQIILKPYASLGSLVLLCAGPHFYFYLLSDASLTVVIRLSSRSVIGITSRVWVCF